MKFIYNTGNTRASSALVYVLLFAAIFAVGGCRDGSKTTAPPASSEFAQTQNEIAKTSPVFAYWQKQFPGAEWASLAKADLNNDGRDDLVVVYNQGENKSSFVVIENLATGYRITEPTPAPVQDQVIKIMDLSGWAQHQFSVSGRKNDVVGMAIFVVDDHKVVMLYTSEYGDCC